MCFFSAGIIQPTWKQVVLEPTKIIVDDTVTFLSLSNNKLESSYRIDPFAGEGNSSIYFHAPYLYYGLIMRRGRVYNAVYYIVI